MPYVSQAQEGYFHTHAAELKKQGVDVGEWDAATKGKHLPARVQAHAKGGLVMALSSGSKSSGPRDAEYAKGGSELSRARDFKKEPDTRFGYGQRTETTKAHENNALGSFLGGVDKFTSLNMADQGTPANEQRMKPDEDWAKTHVSPAKSPVRQGDSKSESPVKPRGSRHGSVSGG
jgi:hypothetical protein